MPRLKASSINQTREGHQGNQKDVMQAVKSDMTFYNVAPHRLICHTLEDGLERNCFSNRELFLECNTNKDDILKNTQAAPDVVC